MILEEKQIKKLTLWYNSYLAMETTVSLDFENGIVGYKSNFSDGRHFESSEGFSLRYKHLLDNFEDYAKSTLSWKPYYGAGKCIDGYYWKLTLEFVDGAIFESRGENGKPEQFDELVERIEMIIEKPIAYRYNESQ